MADGDVETEVKIELDDLAAAREKLRALGAELIRPRELEDNVLYDDAAHSMAATGRVLRVRQVGESGVLTFKAGKAVFTVEYEIKPEVFCTQANALNFNSLHKNYDLDVYRVACRAASAVPRPGRRRVRRAQA